MKGLIVLVMGFLVGCAEFKTLEELEFAALESGDWSAVSQRERMIAKRKARSSPRCPSGSILVCQGRTRDRGCYCGSEEHVSEILRGF